MKTTLAAISLIIAFGALSAATASAQSIYSSNWQSGACVSISRTLSTGSSGSDVTQLQVFLVAQNFPGGGAWMETGHFGAATAAAVRDFQEEKGLPQTGIVDYATRAAISSASCGNLLASPTPVPAIPWNQYGNQYANQYGNQYGSGYPYNYTNGYVSLNLTSLSQNTGNVGQQVTIYGTGFDSTSNTVNFGSIALTGIPSNGSSISFIVPPYTTSGTVNITVTDSRGTSNSLVFTVYNYGCGNNNNYFNSYNSYSGSCGCTTGYNTVYPYTNNGNYGNCGVSSGSGNVYAPTIIYVSPLSGGTGTSVTIFGTGFTATGNTVHFGNGIITNLISTDGSTLSFTIPTQLNGFGTQNTGLGLYNLSVTNGDGYSTGVVPFTVTSLGNTTSGNVTITNVTGPSSLAVGVVGTWTVTLSNPTNSNVSVTPYWGDSNVYPYNGTVVPQTTYSSGVVTLTFTHTYAATGTYNVSFNASNGNGSVTGPVMTVVVTGSTGYGGTPSVSYLSPSSGYVGQQVTIYGSNFASSDTILFGNGAINNVTSNGSTITFTVPSYVGPYCASGTACPQYAISITPGTYNVSVMNSYGTSNTIAFNVL